MAAAAPPLSISVHTSRLRAVEEVCDATLGCAQSDVLSHLLLLVVTGLLAIFVLAAIMHIREARGAVSEERSRTATEQQAFASFAREVSRIDAAGAPAQLTPATGAATAVTTAHAPSDRGLRQVREAYERTVMAMDHYEEEYDEPLARHMGEEFGEEVAAAVESGGQLTPPLKQALLQRAREAASERERLMASLDREGEALSAAADELGALTDVIDDADDRPLTDRTFRQLQDEWNRLGEVESRVSRLLARRQEELGARAVAGRRREGPTLNGYLYAALDTDFPILTDGATLVGRVKDARSRVLTALTRRA